MSAPPGDVRRLRSHHEVERLCISHGMYGWDGGWRLGSVVVYAPRAPENEPSDVQVVIGADPFDGECVAIVPMGAPTILLDVVVVAALSMASRRAS